jgi:regulator of cell morphogenesis and NO signaling
MMNLETTKTVGEVAREIPGATRVFEKFGIDYCCGGNRSMEFACAEAGVKVEEMMHSLKTVSGSQLPAEDSNFSSMTLVELVGHIVDTHHVFTKSEISRLRALMNKVCGVHGGNHKELAQLQSLLERLCGELEPHMIKEEQVLFPYIVRMENDVRNQRSVAMPFFGTIKNPVRMMMAEHDDAGELLKEMRKLSRDYAPPADACISYQTLYQALDAFEKDLHQHIHLENNILFPKAVEMEERG